MPAHSMPRPRKTFLTWLRARLELEVDRPSSVSTVTVPSAASTTVSSTCEKIVALPHEPLVRAGS